MALNVANTVTITAKTAYASLTTVSANVISNAASSNQIYKINNIMVSNYTATNQSCNVVVNRSATGNFNIAAGLVVPANSLLAILGKDISIYLEEGDTLQTSGSANSSLHLTSGYELLS